MIDARKEKILALLEDKQYIPSKPHEMMLIMQVPAEEQDEFLLMLQELAKDGYVVMTKKGKVQSAKRLNIFRGLFHGNAKGFGFVSIEGFDEDIFIPAQFTSGAIHKDTVLLKLVEESSFNRRREGQIVSVLERNYNKIIGSFSEGSKGNGFVIPDDKKLSNDIFIAKGNTRNAVEGHKVVARITKNAEGDRKPEGEILEIIGHENDPGVDILSIVLQNSIPTEFPAEVMREAETLPNEVEAGEQSGREDFREHLVITIDGADAKDLDDAVALVMLENGNYELAVHIADVCAYVKEGSETDKEALKRGTSVYLVDRVIPMLPHVLSNGICSLNPQVDRLCLSCIMELDEAANVVNHRIVEGIIKTRHRMTYDDVYELIIDENSELRAKYSEVLPMIELMNELRKKLWDRRAQRGAIDFGMKESKIIVDENCKPIDIVFRERNHATNLIEEFMLVCNETVAEDFFWAELPFVFRTHEEPDEEKLAKLADVINNFGYTFKKKDIHPKSIQKLLLSLVGKPEEAIISRLTLRSLKQARYTVTCEGHFGLAAKYYSHFTSPIRRYPDLTIHRIIKKKIHSKLNNTEIKRLDAILPEVCRLCSVTERRAEETEREVENLKKVEFMEDKLGEEFAGVISGVTSWGIYVELDNGVEGMVSVNELDDDFYIYNEAELCFIGKNTKKRYSLGDKLNIIVAKADKQNRRLDFALADA